MKSDQHYSTLESKILEWRTTISRIIVILDTSQVFLIYGCSATVAIQHKNVAFDISLVKISLTNLKIRHSKREATDDGSVPFLLVLRNRYPFSLGYFRMYIRCFTMLTRLTIILQSTWFSCKMKQTLVYTTIAHVRWFHLFSIKMTLCKQSDPEMRLKQKKE